MDGWVVEFEWMSHGSGLLEQTLPKTAPLNVVFVPW